MINEKLIKKLEPCYSNRKVAASETQDTKISRCVKNNAMERETKGGLRT
jgi:hypothetical protein